MDIKLLSFRELLNIVCWFIIGMSAVFIGLGIIPFMLWALSWWADFFSLTRPL